jgi:CBS domain containing-hemolysin-like protein
MILFGIGLLVAGIFLSAFFSGNETGFYRASRVRVVMAALDGDQISRALLRLINNPTWFVATTLIGNNVANYLTSHSIVLLTRSISHSSAAEMLMPIFMAPLLFVYGELLPKSLFYQAPNLLLRLCAPLFLIFTFVFAPAAAILWAMSQLLERFIGQSPEKIRLALARKEVQQVLEDGLEAGILEPTQRQLAQSFFLFASKPVSEFFTPLSRIRSANFADPNSKLLKLAKRNHLADIPILKKGREAAETKSEKKVGVAKHGDAKPAQLKPAQLKPAQLIGYVRTIDLLIASDAQERSTDKPIRQLMEIKSTELFGEAVLQMQSARETLAKVIDEKGNAVGVLSLDQMTNRLLEGSLGSLHR